MSDRPFSFRAPSLVVQIVIGLVAGIVLSQLWPGGARAVDLLGTVFISALKAVAPVLVLVLVTASIANHRHGQKTNLRFIIALYVLGTLAAALVGVTASFLFPSTLTLKAAEVGLNAPSGIGQVLRTLLMQIVDNPVHALLNANYIGLLAWAVGLGLALRHASESTRTLVSDLSQAVTWLVRMVIRLAPLGVFGIVASLLAESGLGELKTYLHLLYVLVGAMLFMALVGNPLIVAVVTRRNPYPLVLRCLRESGITAFFTRSSAANIPVNMELCRKLGLQEENYSVAIPLGATINMAGAAITISVLTLAAVNTLGIVADLPTALLLSVLAAVGACGASGVPGGSLLLIPLACSLFGISNDIAMQVVAVGFIVGVVQDSAETALNSSTDVVFVAAAEQARARGLPPPSALHPGGAYRPVDCAGDRPVWHLLRRAGCGLGFQRAADGGAEPADVHWRLAVRLHQRDRGRWCRCGGVRCGHAAGHPQRGIRGADQPSAAAARVVQAAGGAGDHRRIGGHRCQPDRPGRTAPWFLGGRYRCIRAVEPVHPVGSVAGRCARRSAPLGAGWGGGGGLPWPAVAAPAFARAGRHRRGLRAGHGAGLAMAAAGSADPAGSRGGGVVGLVRAGAG